jgi:site-specific DNA recombinase
MASAQQLLSRSAAAVAIQPVRCAVYGRVSTDAQAGKDFNSNEAQQEACETYIGLHRDEGWRVVPEPYLDAGFSGSNTKRPELQRLIADIEAGEIDVVVVYKYDRLSRSMLDFLQLLDSFKRHGVSFVSVSQRFDTSTPVGEMTLNILLSFAQFERQIIGERTRDKLRSARRAGRWTGGFVPLGHDVAPEGGKLVVNKDEARIVRAIFELYVESPSLVDVSQELNRRGWKRKSWTTKDGKRREGTAWDRKTLSNTLRDVTYVGKVRLGSEVFPGEHRGIVPKALFEKVQMLLDRNLRDRGASARNKHAALLRGLLRCSACDVAMVFAPSKRKGKVYRYYRCGAAGRNGHDTCPTKSINADQIEQFVVDQIRHIGAAPALQEETFRQAVAQVKAQRRGLKLELRRLKTDLTQARANVQRLVEAVSRTTGRAADAIASELTSAQERVAGLEARQKQIKEELAALDTQVVNRDELARALESFDPIWDVLLTPEKERVLGLLIERIDFDGGTDKLQINWRLAGFGQLAKEVGA